MTENDVYRGMGNYLDLLKDLTEMKISFAKHMNPLSNLPGNVPISQQISSFIDSAENFTVCYFDLDHFKPYNDTYGFSKGDEVIRKVSELLCQHSCENNDFVGHVGGDDFVVDTMDTRTPMPCTSSSNRQKSPSPENKMAWSI